MHLNLKYLFLVLIWCELSVVITACDNVDQTIREEGRVSVRYPDARPTPEAKDMMPADMMPADMMPADMMPADMMPADMMPADMTMNITSNQPPIFERVRPRVIEVGEEVTFNVSAFDEMPESLTYQVDMLPNGAEFSTTELLFTWTPSVMQGGQDYSIIFQVYDGEFRDFLNVQITVTPPCNSGLRQTPPCGYEQCQAGQWVAADLVPELCNGYDEDCDGTIDESPNDTLSTCCDDSCHLRSYCVQEMCVELTDGRCNYNGDCAENEICVARSCIEDTLSSCQNPIVFNQPSMLISGIESNSQITRSESGCLINDERLGDSEGAEMVFVYESSEMEIVNFSASVTVNEVSLPISLTITTICPLNDQAQFACVENYSQGGVSESLRLSFEVEARQSYFIIIDTLGSLLQNELVRQGAQLEDVGFNLFMR